MTPGYVATAMTGISRTDTNFVRLTPESFAKSAVATIGIQNNTCGCFPHALQVIMERGEREGRRERREERDRRGRRKR